MVTRVMTTALALLLTLPSLVFAAQVTAVADRDRLGAGESLQLELRVKGSPDGEADLGPLEKDWEILGRSQSTQMQIINGSLSRSLVLSLSLMPKRSGEVEIPPLCFGADCSAALPVTVGGGAQAAASTDPLVLEAVAEPGRALVGAQILLRVRVLHRVELAQASLSEPRVEQGEADIRQLGKDRSFEERRDGWLYQGIERQYVIFSRKAGPLLVAPLQLDAQVDAGSSRQGFFGRSVRQVRRTTESIRIEVGPPPADMGSRAWLPARGLSLQDDWQHHPPSLRVGEPATRTLTLKAEGLAAANLPELQVPVPEGFKSYPDQPSREDGEDERGIVGTLQQKLALVPTRPGEVELPAVDLDWYDVEAGRWSRVHLDPIRVMVAPAAPGSVVGPPVVQAPSVAPAPAAEPVPPAAAQPLEPPPSSGVWPWISLGLGLAWMATLVVLWRVLRRKPSESGETSVVPENASEKAALKAVLEAAGRNEAAATREALVRWGRLRFPQAAGAALDVLRRTDPGLDRALAELDRALYSPAPGRWRGESLTAALLGMPGPEKKLRPELPPLYPGQPR